MDMRGSTTVRSPADIRQADTWVLNGGEAQFTKHPGLRITTARRAYRVHPCHRVRTRSLPAKLGMGEFRTGLLTLVPRVIFSNIVEMLEL